MVDIILTYLNEKEPTWIKEYYYYQEEELKSKNQELNNRQAFGLERFRDWDTFKYCFRGIEKNLPWINRIFLVVQNEKHVPDWINKDNPKLRIVYHEDFMPKELLPVFNIVPIQIYFSKINDLGEYFIVCDDDEFFLNPIKEDMFLRDNKPVHKDNRLPFEYYSGDYLTGSDNVFFHILNNTLKLETKYMKEPIKYGFYHLPDIRSKSFSNKILEENYEELYNSCKVSKFRHKDNILGIIYTDLLKICGEAYIDNNLYSNSSYCCLKSNVDFNLYQNKDIVCFNDTELLDDFDKTKRLLTRFLESKLPNKSSFEK